MPGRPVVPDIPTVPDVPVIVEVPGQGTAEALGVVRGVVGLSPALPSSVAPSGIAPLIVDPAVNPVLVDPALIVPMLVDDPATPSVLPAVAELQPVEVIEFDTEPPPSNVDIDPDIPIVDPDVPIVDPDIPVPVVPVVIHGVVLIMGLSPPEFSSVAPKGIPVPCEGALEDVAPRGDVAPMPGTGATCAKLGPPLKIIRLAAMVRTRRIETSVSLPAPLLTCTL
jgi:hypothetical protein